MMFLTTRSLGRSVATFLLSLVVTVTPVLAQGGVVPQVSRWVYAKSLIVDGEGGLDEQAEQSVLLGIFDRAVSAMSADDSAIGSASASQLSDVRLSSAAIEVDIFSRLSLSNTVLVAAEASRLGEPDSMAVSELIVSFDINRLVPFSFDAGVAFGGVQNRVEMRLVRAGLDVFDVDWVDRVDRKDTFNVDGQLVPGNYALIIRTTSESIGATSGVVTLDAAFRAGDLPCGVADISESFGELDVNDVIGFVSGFNAGDQIADIAPPGGDGLLNVNDVIDFVAAFNAGCP
jgi:hypothetical protein